MTGSPEEQASLWSRVWFMWVSPLLALGKQRPLEVRDLFAIPADDAIPPAAREIRRCLSEHTTRKRHWHSLVRALYEHSKSIMFWCTLPSLLTVFTGAVVPFLMSAIIDFAGSTSDSASKSYGLSLVSSLLALRFMHLMVHSLVGYRFTRLGLRMEMCLSRLVHLKLTRLATVHNGLTTNVLSVDASRVADVVTEVPQLISIPTAILVNFAILYWFMGTSALVCVVVMLCLIPFTAMLAKRLEDAEEGMMKYKDKRVNALSEMLRCAAAVKQFAMERTWHSRVSAIRNREAYHIKRLCDLDAFEQFVIMSLDPLLCVVLLTSHTLLGGSLEPHLVFPAFVVLESLADRVFQVPEMLVHFTQSRVSMRRLYRFLESQELDNPTGRQREHDEVEWRPASNFGSSTSQDTAVQVRFDDCTFAAVADKNAQRRDKRDVHTRLANKSKKKTADDGPTYAPLDTSVQAASDSDSDSGSNSDSDGGGRRGAHGSGDDSKIETLSSQHIAVEMADLRGHREAFSSVSDIDSDVDEHKGFLRGAHASDTAGGSDSESSSDDDDDDDDDDSSSESDVGSDLDDIVAPMHELLQGITLHYASSTNATSLDAYRLVNAKGGQLVAIVGRVGAGKTSLCLAALGELPCVKGQVSVIGTTAYAPQQAWIRNASVRDNILFGLPLEPQWYSTVVQACALDVDIAEMPHKDLTLLGEHGTNISGGQRARISLARAVYRRSDIVVLDDPLAAVDRHVADHLFKRVLRGLLASKLVLLVAHQQQYLADVDSIVIMENGTVKQQGSFQHLQALDVDLSQYLPSEPTTDDDDDDSSASEDDEEVKQSDRPRVGNLSPDSSSGSSSESDSESGSEDDERTSPSAQQGQTAVCTTTERDLIEEQWMVPSSPSAHVASGLGSVAAALQHEEERQTGVVDMQVYKSYLFDRSTLRSMGVVLLLCVLYQGATGLAQMVEAYWTQHSLEESRGLEHSNTPPGIGFLGLYVVLNALAALGSASRQFVWARTAVTRASALHSDLLNAILAAPLSFFETTPMGRIVNRFSNDQESVDSEIPMLVSDWFLCIFSACGTLIVLWSVMPLMLIFCAPVAVVYFYLQQYFRASCREVRRMVSITWSPVLAHHLECASGLHSIRAYDAQKFVAEENLRFLNTHYRTARAEQYVSNWLEVRLDALGILLFGGVGVIAVWAHGRHTAAFVGLALSLVQSTVGSLQWYVRSSAELEAQMSSVERILHYTATESEDNSRAQPITEQWPAHGAVALHDVFFRYPSREEYALQDLNIRIRPAEKIGIIGRTGAGKTTISKVLLRLVEVERGRVEIDGVDISRVHLETLRTAVAIIPQEPTLFSGTIRANVDPHKQHSTNELREVLRQLQLLPFVDSLRHGLNTKVAHGGSNLSAGQRQLLCMARAVLRRCRVLIMDEATASCDAHTDKLIQETLRTVFAKSTVITIAHRLETLSHYDRVLVMDAGRVVREYDPKVTTESNGL